MASRPPKAAVTARGRPATGALRTQVRLTPADIERARVLGGGNVSAGIRLALAQFLCVECGFEENADLVGAINVLRAGHARFACEVSDAVGSPAAGTHRSDSGVAQCRA